MKIIGKTDEGYLLSATEEDINRLIGEYYLKYTDEKNLTPEQLAFKKAQKLLGMEIPLHEMYTAAREVTREWEEKRENQGYGQVPSRDGRHLGANREGLRQAKERKGSMNRKQRRNRRHIKKKAAHAVNCGIAAVGSFGMAGLALWFLCFVPAPKAEVLHQARQTAEFSRIMSERLKPSHVEFVTQPVHLYKPGEKLSKSAAAVAKANDVALLAAFVPGEVAQ